MKNSIRERRKALGLRQEDLAVETGVTRQTINAVENARYNPTLELAMRLARLLNTPVEALFELDAQPGLQKKLARDQDGSRVEHNTRRPTGIPSVP